MDKLVLMIKTPGKPIHRSENIDRIRIPLVDGFLGVHPGHAPLIAEIKPGPLTYYDMTGNHQIMINSGILKIFKNEVIILAGGEKFNFTSPDLNHASDEAFDRMADALLSNLYPPPDTDPELNEITET
jgi:F0F1-type ATP synthase epsilon subunit